MQRRVRHTDDVRAHGGGSARRRGPRGGNFFGYSLGHYYVFGDHVPGETDVWKEYIEKRSEVGYSPEIEAALNEERLGAKVAAGTRPGPGCDRTPEQIREYVQRFEDAGVDQLIFVMQAGKNKHEDICESLEIFGREVLPSSGTATKRSSRRKPSDSSRSSTRRWPARSTTRRRCLRLLVPRDPGPDDEGQRRRREVAQEIPGRPRRRKPRRRARNPELTLLSDLTVTEGPPTGGVQVEI